MSVYQNINGTLARMDASDLVQIAAVDTEGILGGTPGATTDGQTLVDQLAADDVQAQTDIGQIKTDLSDIDDAKVGWSDQKQNGAYNLYGVTATTQVIRGVTFTVNPSGYPKGTIIANGKAVGGNASFGLENITDYIDINKTYKAVGCPSGGNANSYWLQFNYVDSNNSQQVLPDYGNGVIYETKAVKDSGNNKPYIWVTIKEGYTADNLIFKPMITTDINATYDDYVPYAMTNRELTYTHKTYYGTTDANSNLASDLAFNAKRFGLYAVLDNNAGTSYVLQRSYSSNLTAFWVYNGVNASTTANKGVTIHYYEYN